MRRFAVLCCLVALLVLSAAGQAMRAEDDCKGQCGDDCGQCCRLLSDPHLCYCCSSNPIAAMDRRMAGELGVLALVGLARPALQQAAAVSAHSLKQVEGDGSHAPVKTLAPHVCYFQTRWRCSGRRPWLMRQATQAGAAREPCSRPAQTPLQLWVESCILPPSVNPRATHHCAPAGGAPRQQLAAAIYSCGFKGVQAGISTRQSGWEVGGR